MKLNFRHPLVKILWMILIIGMDHASKYWAQLTLRGRPMATYIYDLFRLEYAENTGAFLSLGSRLPEQTRLWLFVVAVGVFLGFALYYLFFDPKNDRTSVIALSLICAGGIANLIDRIFRPNHGVVDFLNVGIGELRTGIFNIADMAILLGVILLALKSLKATDSDSSSVTRTP